jgi:hypothetical protein
MVYKFSAVTIILYESFGVCLGFQRCLLQRGDSHVYTGLTANREHTETRARGNTTFHLRRPLLPHACVAEQPTRLKYAEKMI